MLTLVIILTIIVAYTTFKLYKDEAKVQASEYCAVLKEYKELFKGDLQEYCKRLGKSTLRLVKDFGWLVVILTAPITLLLGYIAVTLVNVHRAK